MLARLQITELNTMQLAAIAALVQHDRVVLLSPTGSGKTLGFLLPLAQQLQTEKSGVQALIITPTRELALQIETVFRKMGTEHKVNTSYGGHSMKTERNNFSEPPALLIGTPGRLADHADRGNIDLSGVNMLVLDEFDKCLEMGFHEDIAYILSRMPKVRKRLLVSATSLETIPDFAGMEGAEKLNFLTQEVNTQLTLKRVIGPDTEKPDLLVDLLCNLTPGPTLIFCNHRETVERISDFLTETGIQNAILHGGLEQDERERALIRFRNGSADYLVTTDLASRGLDIPDIQHVIHYQLPQQEAAFVHRNGRTARQSATGNAWLVLSENDRLPAYFTQEPPLEHLKEHEPLPPAPEWKTLYFGGGKKDKINKVDIVGFLSKIGQLKPNDIGLISVMDHSCLVAVRASKVNQALPLIRNEKVKGKKIKIGIAR